MSGEGAEVPRARPLSGGLWTLFSWLRRDERVSGSSESLSSAGSARTAASFAFLPPARLRPAAAQPREPSPPTDSYRRRVRDRSLRRLHDRDLTLHRKYGLFDGGYDTFSLPYRGAADAARQERESRAVSESAQRRAAHVPGKRRAPPPPATLPARTRCHTRKRPAPPPPTEPTDQHKKQLTPDKTYIALMSSNSTRDTRPLSSTDCSMGCKSEKYSKKDNDSKDSKVRSEKSFLKQLFENRKRNSAIEVAPTKILPNISELDKQATEIIESCKLRALEQNNNFTDRGMLSKGDMWFCTRCLRKYNSTMITCLYCLPEQRKLTNGLIKDKSVTSNASNIYTQTANESAPNVSTSRISGVAPGDRQKLKEMLKEMKDSLPKRPKHDKTEVASTKAKSVSLATNADAPTLRIGSTVRDENNTKPVVTQPSSSKLTSGPCRVKITEINGSVSNNVKLATIPETVVITQPIVLVAPQPRDKIKLNLERASCNPENTPKPNTSLIKNVEIFPKIFPQHENKINNGKPNELIVNSVTSIKPDIHSPLKISSLLNPVYVPKCTISGGQSHTVENKSVISETAVTVKPITTVSNEEEQISKSYFSKLKSRSEAIPEDENAILERKDVNQHNITKATSPNKTAVPDNVKAKPLKRVENKPRTVLVSTGSTTSNTPSTSSDKPSGSNVARFSIEQHSRRRDLINQLEQSIAKGDEKAAAEAAAKLAQLRLSCSVLSFSSQIAADISKLIPNTFAENTTALDDKKVKTPIENNSKANTDQTEKIALPMNNKASVNINKGENAIKVGEVKPSSSIVKTEFISRSNVANKAEILPLNPRPSTSEVKSEPDNGTTLIEVWVEDREATRGPVRLRVSRSAAVGELRRQAEAALGLAARLQRWIVGRALCADDSAPLVSLAGPDLSAPFYLCLVESDPNTETPQLKPAETHPEGSQADVATDVYAELVLLEQRALVPNAEPFECGVCMEECGVARGAMLRECAHAFCRDCLSDLVRHCEELAVACPAMGCVGVLQEREIRALAPPAEYERWLARGLAAAESGTRNAFHCRTRDCAGWAFCEPGVRRFPCPVCKRANCVPCQAIHEGQTCEQHRIKLRETAAAPGANQADEGTQALLDTLITKGEALQCPECSAIITKKWGCDWVKCSACKTEICWVTRGRRWGPGGRGDTSAGCRCGVDGKRCHPSCGYCH